MTHQETIVGIEWSFIHVSVMLIVRVIKNKSKAYKYIKGNCAIHMWI